MIPNDYLKIFWGMYKKTKENKLNWSKGTKANEFIAAVGFYIAVIQKNIESVDYNEYERIYFSLREQEGDEIDSFDITDDEKGFKEANELFLGARRSALKINEAVKELEKELGVDDEILEPPELTPPPDSEHPPEIKEDDDLPF
ncbi:hypothetical protein TRIP_C20232 [Candidatus Zixiibacteriota bacterium]|nr:hypothetical protein TRIP_C20232 [candidate division Zixibacteria bacterium]